MKEKSIKARSVVTSEKRIDEGYETSEERSDEQQETSEERSDEQKLEL